MTDDRDQLATIDSSSRSTRRVVTNALKFIARGASQYRALSGVAERLDGWASVLNGARGMVDRVGQFVPAYFRRLSDQVLISLFHGDPTARKACEARPKAALAKGVTITIPREAGGAKASTAMLDELERLRAVEKLRLACVWENLLGGAVVFVSVDDGNYGPDSQVLPLDLGSVQRVHRLTVLDRRRVHADTVLDDDETSETYGEPLYFMIDGGNGYYARVHRSRLIIFPGATTSFELRSSWGGWGVSLLDAAFAAMQRSGLVWSNAAQAVANSGYTVYKLKGLSHMLMSQDGEEKTKRRAQAMELAKSMISAILIDADDEYSRESFDFGDYPDLLDSFMYDVAHSLDMPVTFLFGRSPAGQNSTGASDRDMWHASVENEQEHKLRPRFHQLCEIIFAAKQGPFKGIDPGGWRVGFPPLRQLSDLERAELRLKTSQADALDIDRQVLTAAEVALSRYRAEGYSTETSIDEEMRREPDMGMLEAGGEGEAQRSRLP